MLLFMPGVFEDNLIRIYGKDGLMKAVEIKANGSPTSKGQAAALNEGPKGTVLAGNNAKRAGFETGETMELQNIETISVKKIKIYKKNNNIRYEKASPSRSGPIQKNRPLSHMSSINNEKTIQTLVCL